MGDALPLHFCFCYLITRMQYLEKMLNDGCGNGYLCLIPDFNGTAFIINFGVYYFRYPLSCEENFPLLLANCSDPMVFSFDL